jgi:hypothetical protein
MVIPFFISDDSFSGSLKKFGELYNRVQVIPDPRILLRAWRYVEKFDA